MPTDDAAATLLSLLAPIDGMRERLQELALGRPTPQSAAAVDAMSWLPGAGVIYASQNIGIGVDHLWAWRRLLEGGLIPGFAHMTLLRSAIEGAAIARWLVTPDSSSERVRRAAIFGLEERRHRREFERTIEELRRKEAAALGTDYIPPTWSGTAKSGAQRYDDHFAKMAAAGVIAERPPSVTQLVDDYGAGAHVYQLTSAFAHRREWAMAFSDEVDRIPDTGPGSGALQLEASTAWAIRITRIAMDVIADAQADLELYVGHAGADG